MPNVHAVTLRRAAEILGGEAALASTLGVSAKDLAGWLRGTSTPPTKVFLQAVDIVSAHASAPPKKP